MAEPVPAGSDVSAGTYSCTSCHYKLDLDSTRHLPPCPRCGNGKWHTVTGGDPPLTQKHPTASRTPTRTGKESRLNYRSV